MVRKRPITTLLSCGAMAVGLLSVCKAQTRQEWVGHRPSLPPQMQSLDINAARPLLAHFCRSLSNEKDNGLICATANLGSEFTDIIDDQFHPQSFISGHFQQPDSENVMVSGWSFESHPFHWGGTLLLSHVEGEWRPIWYKSGVITTFCEKAAQPDKREILLCEFEDGGMGHRYHVLYVVDARKASARIAPLVEADSFSNGCVSQKQFMGAVKWNGDHQRFSVDIRTPSWMIDSAVACGQRPPKRPPISVSLQFEMSNDGVRSSDRSQ